ncbi:amidohydrolase [Kroppenstedtia pulmonis]|uniref:Amidohydrolase n=1 Tax=Kroppenstedtia pulmonis TaxID=1380685 RepID=A0A7D4BI93_9BACL|nr:amidohydrolase [Kroppenstedtia pulmonis]QKG85195.1 amidohydrolase [Kroppenstedtia pulmonis]
MKQIRQRIETIFPQMVEWRRYLHQNPELSFHEIRTAEFVADRLRSMNIKVCTGVGGNGVVGLLSGGRPGKKVALRADIDALPIQDEKTCTYRSRVPGVMHACGHDAHTATLLGVASLMSTIREEIPGQIIFMFQHAEEVIPGGAVSMIKDGVLEGVDAVYGVHLWTPLPCGVVGLRSGALMAAADSFEIEVVGQGGHGGLPHETVDAVAIASHLVVNLQTIVSRQLDPLQSGVISVGTIKGGRSFNVIAEESRLTGTVRTFDPEIRQFIQHRIKEVAEQTCSMFGARCRFKYDRGYPPVMNDQWETQRMEKVARRILGNDQVKEIQPVMAGEDFAYYLQKRPGAFCFVGAGNREKGITFPHHHPRFDLDEQGMKVAAELMMETALSRLKEGEKEVVY